MELWNILSWKRPTGSSSSAPGPAKSTPTVPPHTWEHGTILALGNVSAGVPISGAHGVLWGPLAVWGGCCPLSHTVALFRWPLGWELMLVMDTGVHLALCCLAGGHGLCLGVFGADPAPKPAAMRAGFPRRLSYPPLSSSWQKHGIPVPVTPQTPWSMDENLMHIR